MTVCYLPRAIDDIPVPRRMMQWRLPFCLLSLLTGYALYAAMVFTGLHPLLALTAQFTLCWEFNLRGPASHVFRMRAAARSGLYVATNIVVYLSNVYLLHLILNAGLDAYLAQALALVPIAILSHVLNSHTLGVQPRSCCWDLL